MDVILLERVEKLGRIGDVVKVKNGFARNYLLPRGKALRATDANKAKFEAERAQIEADNERRRAAAAVDAKSMEGVTVVLIRQASHSGSLYGSVSARDIVAVLAEAGHKVARGAVVLNQPIKTLGIVEVKLVPHPDVQVVVKVNVARSPEEAELQAQGIDVTAEDLDERAADIEDGFDQAPEPGEVVEAEADTDTAAAGDSEPA